MKTKVYGLRGMASGQLHTTFCGVDVTLNFFNGMNAYGHSHAVLITTEPFVQDAIENDERFGGAIVLEKEFDSPEAANNEYQPKSVTLDPDQQLSPTVRALQAKAEAEKVAKAQEAEAAAKRSAAAKKGAATKKAKKAAEKIEFANVNEAIAFFLDKGVVDVSEETLPELLEQYNAVILSEE